MHALALKTCGVAPRARRWKAGEGVAGHGVIASAAGGAVGSKANLGRLSFGCCIHGRGADRHAVRSRADRDRRLPLLTKHVDLLRAVFRDTRARHPFTIEAIVVLPDHLHAIWTLPEDDADFATRWRLIKSTFSRALPENEIVRWVESSEIHHGDMPRSERISRSRASKGERGIWQRRYWEHTLRDETDFARHVDYIHFNPVKHGHAGRVEDWPHSSFHRMVRLGVYPQDWAGNMWIEGSDFGER